MLPSFWAAGGRPGAPAALWGSMPGWKKIPRPPADGYMRVRMNVRAGRTSHRINNRYLAFFRYLVRHKRYVAVAARDLGIPVRGLLHDLSPVPAVRVHPVCPVPLRPRRHLYPAAGDCGRLRGGGCGLPPGGPPAPAPQPASLAAPGASGSGRQSPGASDVARPGEGDGGRLDGCRPRPG